MRLKSIYFTLIIAVLGMLVGCGTDTIAEAFKLKPESFNNRQMQTKIFDTNNTESILSASAMVLQDMGYVIDEAEHKLGIIVGDKERETDNKGQKMLAHAGTILNAFSGKFSNEMYAGVEDKQKIRVALVITQLSQKRVSVRVSFQRKVWDMQGYLFRLETLKDPKLYQGFFEKLSQSIFLEAHNI